MNHVFPEVIKKGLRLIRLMNDYAVESPFAEREEEPLAGEDPLSIKGR